MKKLVGLLLLAVFVVAFGVGVVISAKPASAGQCTTTCDPTRCASKCALQGKDGFCVKGKGNCYTCVCSIIQ